jgi:hypothetical protein
MAFTHRVYFSFFVRGDGDRGERWILQFSPPTLDRALGRRRSALSEQAIRDLIARTPTRLTLEDRQALDTALHKGRGGLFLELTPEQFAALQR